MDPSLLFALFAFLAVGGVGVAFAGPGQSARAQKRVKAVGSSKSERRKQVNTVEVAAQKRRQSTQDALKDLAANEKQSRKRRLSVKGRLAQAGINATPTSYWIAALVLGVVLALIGFIVQGSPIGALAGLFVGGLGLPHWILGFLVKGRQKKFAAQLSDAIDVIVRGVKSGLPLGQCLRIIAAESPEPLRSEFQQLVDSQAMGVTIDQGLQRMYERMPLSEVNFFAIVLTIQQKTGGNLSESLGNLSQVLRARKLMREKVKALSAEATASAMIIGSLPIIVMTMVYFTRPDYIMILFIHPTGNLILLGASVMMGAGIFIMNKMINFKF